MPVFSIAGCSGGVTPSEVDEADEEGRETTEPAIEMELEIEPEPAVEAAELDAGHEEEEMDGENPDCGCYDTSQQASLDAYKTAVSSSDFPDYISLDGEGRPSFVSGKPVIGNFLTENNPYDPMNYTDICGTSFETPDKYYAYRMRQHECLTGKKVASGLVHLAFSWDGEWYPIPAAMLNAIHNAYCEEDGCDENKMPIPFLKYMPLDWARQTENVYPQSEIAAGGWDSELRTRCGEIRDLGYPVILAYAPEANGNWFPYGRVDLGNTPETVAAANNYLRNICEEEGANKIIWAYNPNVWNPWACAVGNGPDECPVESVNAYYPGDFIALILLDGYNFGTSQAWSNWQSFDDIYLESVVSLRGQHPDKFFGSGEMGSSTSGGNKPEWLLDAFQKMTQPPYEFALFYYFNPPRPKETDWVLFFK